MVGWSETGDRELLKIGGVSRVSVGEMYRWQMEGVGLRRGKKTEVQHGVKWTGTL